MVLKQWDFSPNTKIESSKINDNFNDIYSAFNALNLKFNNFKIVNVKDFGAVGDGVTDDTEAIQNAIYSISQSSITPNTIAEAYRYGGVVLIPRGKYKTTSTIYIPAYIKVIGQGRVSFGDLTLSSLSCPGTIIYYCPANTNTWAVRSGNFVVSTGQIYTSNTEFSGSSVDDGTYSEVRDSSLENLTIYTSTSNVLGGVLFMGAANSSFKNISVNGSFSYGIKAKASWDFLAETIHAHISNSNAIGIYFSHDMNGLQVNTAYSTTNKTDGTAFKFNYCTASSLNNIICEHSFIGLVEAAGRANVYNGLYFEDIADTLINLADTARPIINGINAMSQCTSAKLISITTGVTKGEIHGVMGTVGSLLYGTNAYTELSIYGLTLLGSTTGSINSASNILTVASASGIIQGQGIIVYGAGAAGGNLTTTVSSISGTTITLADNAATAVNSANVSFLIDTLAYNTSSKIKIIPDAKTEYYSGSSYTLTHSMPSMSGSAEFIKCYRFNNIGQWGIKITPNTYNIYDWSSGNVKFGLDITNHLMNLIDGTIFKVGTGSPEGVVSANIGSLYLNSSGGANTTLYIKTSGSGNTGWTAK